jgi:hypothetical protein
MTTIIRGIHEEAKGGTVTITPMAGGDSTTATLDDNGAYEVELDTNETGFVVLIESDDVGQGPISREYRVIVLPGFAADTSTGWGGPYASTQHGADTEANAPSDVRDVDADRSAAQQAAAAGTTSTDMAASSTQAGTAAPANPPDQTSQPS